MSISEPLRLPCGATLPNRLAKGAMTEGLATPDGVPTQALQTLYRRWSQGGAGMHLTGNVIIDRDHLERPGNVVIDRAPDAEMKAALAAWAKAGTEAGNHLWMQISHAGRQTQALVNKTPKAPSAVKLGLPGGQFGEPVPLTGEEIEDLIGRFVTAATAAKEAGFTGVQIHAAHGYLISQFLSPRANQRTDQWGGSLENRMRFVLEAFKEIRKQTGEGFIVGVKLNSADFQKGGFSEDESIAVVKALDALGVDFIEISGGTYEAPAMTGVKQSTRQREAYFLEFAEKVRGEVKTALMVTGGFRTRSGMDAALQSGACDLIGIARPLAVETDAPNNLVAGQDVKYAVKPIKTGIKPFDNMGVMEIIWYAAQFKTIGAGKTPDPNLSPLKVFANYLKGNVKAMFKGKKTFGRLRA